VITSPFPGISGTVTSLACAPNHVGSTSLDRFFRLHETASKKGQTLEKVYTKSIPTVVAWDSSYEDRQPSIPGDDDEEDGVWESMENAEDGEDHNDGEDEGSSGDERSPNPLHKKSRTR